MSQRNEQTNLRFKPKSSDHYDIDITKLYTHNGTGYGRNLLSKDCILQMSSEGRFTLLKGACEFNNGRDKNDQECAGIYLDTSDLTKLEVKDG